jgi:hypothetical protein
MAIYKGAQQRSLFGPFGYNIFAKMSLLVMKDYCNIYNYADGNTLSCYGTDLGVVTCHMMNALNVRLDWFKKNGLKANHQ